jgi:sigma-B regulation protein RsbU (phosphoserine phosphatase)
MGSMRLEPAVDCTCEGGALARRAMEADLRLARDVQRTLVPCDVEAPGLRVRVHNLPCGYVGGDYLQASLVRPDVLHLCVGDVSGHGIAAALVVSRIHGHVRRMVLEDRRPLEMLDELNAASLRIFRHVPSFLTFASFRVDLAARRIEYATGGHPAQALLRAGGGIELLSSGDRLLGVDERAVDADRPSPAVSYRPGDCLVLFTDGLFEVPRADGLRLHEPELHERLASLRDPTTEAVVEAALRGLEPTRRPTRFADDVSLLVASFPSEPSHAPPDPTDGSGQPRCRRIEPSTM